MTVIRLGIGIGTETHYNIVTLMHEQGRKHRMRWNVQEGFACLESTLGTFADLARISRHLRVLSAKKQSNTGKETSDAILLLR